MQDETRTPNDSGRADPKPTPPHPAVAPNEATPGIRLDHFLQRADAVQSGGHAKMAIQGGEVTVDGVVETRRRRKLAGGSRVAFAGAEYRVP